MSGTIQGYVGEVLSFKTKTGKDVFSVVVDGKKYSAGFDRPKANPGDLVSFNIEMNGQYANVAKGSLRVLPPGSGAAPAPAAPARSGGGFDDRQDTISRQAASNTALEFLRLAESIGALGMAKTAKAEDKLTALEELVNEYTALFYERNTGKEFKDISPSAKTAIEGAMDAAQSATGGW
jgi:hypothetical protein